MRRDDVIPVYSDWDIQEGEEDADMSTHDWEKIWYHKLRFGEYALRLMWSEEAHVAALQTLEKGSIVEVHTQHFHNTIPPTNLLFDLGPEEEDQAIYFAIEWSLEKEKELVPIYANSE